LTNKLIIKAGRAAHAHIQENGLAPKDIRAIIGASGAAKWLSIYGLDRAIFSQWLNGISHRIRLLGTSIGAWKLAAAAQNDPGRAFDCLKNAYISQTYRGRITPEKITSESLKILNRFLPRQRIDEIFTHPFIKLGFASVRCKGPMAMENNWALSFGILSAFALNLFSRRTQGLFFERTLFHVPGAGQWPLDLDGFSLARSELTPENFQQALLSSGSIPIIMEGIRDIPGAAGAAGTPKGVYRDGGILDYHPAFPMNPGGKGFTLYPHFYPEIIPGWFDKKLAGRRAGGRLMDHTILVAPSPEFVAKLPCARIPDRKDFVRYHGRDKERYRIWQAAAKKSRELGDAFLEAVESGRIRRMVTHW